MIKPGKRNRAPVFIENPLEPGRIGAPAVALRGVTKRYADLPVLDRVDFVAPPGLVIGLLGPNGAGKSTLLKIIAGIVTPSAGELALAGHVVDGNGYGPQQAAEHGVFTVHQELALFTSLSSAENLLLAWGPHAGGRRRGAERAASAAIARVFPGSQVRPNEELGNLSIGDRQLVEIAITACHPAARLLILDEPTSSLGADRVSQLHRYLSLRKQTGVAIIYVTHKLDDVLEVADELAVLRDGRLQWAGSARSASRASLVLALSGEPAPTEPAACNPAPVAGVKPEPSAGVTATSVGVAQVPGPAVLELPVLSARNGGEEVLVVRQGEVVGLAGLEGAGQRSLLRRAFRKSSRSMWSSNLTGAAYVSGDRRAEGLFPLWDIQDNLIISALGKVSGRGIIRPGRAQALAAQWFKTLKIAAPGVHAPVGELSGGTQQKVLIARGLASGAPLLLLDDPTRGVDIQTKQEVYSLLQALRKDGRGALWYSTEDREFSECDRVYVMADGAVVGELSGAEISRERVVSLSYARPGTVPGPQAATPAPGHLWQVGRRGLGTVVNSRASLAALLMVGMMVATVTTNGASASTTGMDLILTGTIPLVFASLAQMFVVLAGGFDLGVGYAVGLANVVCAGVLPTRPLLAVVLVAMMIAGYALMAGIVEVARVPAVVVTLGASFVWLGVGLVLQPTPGGTVPGWLETALNASLPGPPEPVYILIGVPLIAIAVLRGTHYGVTLRAFGNNRAAFTETGRSSLLAMAGLYTIAGLCAVLAGAMVTAINTSSDINGSSTLTLASFAAVVVGGSEFVGGIVTAGGTVMAAVGLGLLVSFMTLVNLPSIYVSAAEGAILVLAMLARLGTRRAVVSLP